MIGKEISFIYKVNNITYKWNGGTYIEMFVEDELGLRSTPFDIINVWDYKLGVPYIVPKIEHFVMFINKYVKENAEELREM